MDWWFFSIQLTTTPIPSTHLGLDDSEDLLPRGRAQPQPRENDLVQIQIVIFWLWKSYWRRVKTGSATGSAQGTFLFGERRLGTRCLVVPSVGRCPIGRRLQNANARSRRG